MLHDFTCASLGKIKDRVFRLGLSATYWPGKKTIYRALDAGVNYFFLYGFDAQMTRTLREVLQKNREQYVVATGAYNLIWWHQDLRKTLEKRLRQLGTDYIDVFHFLGVMKPKEITSEVRDGLAALRQDSRVRGVAISCHDRKLAGQLAARGDLDVLMARYNAAHRGAETEIFPYLAEHQVGLVSYTATRWRYLLRRPGNWPKEGRVPTAGMCYRFVLSNPSVDVCMNAPSNLKHLEENLAALREGPLSPEDMDFMRKFGDAVHERHKRFL